jgi:hypothetical protein
MPPRCLQRQELDSDGRSQGPLLRLAERQRRRRPLVHPASCARPLRRAAAPTAGSVLPSVPVPRGCCICSVDSTVCCAPTGKHYDSASRVPTTRTRLRTRPQRAWKRHLDASFEDRRERITWRRRQLMDGRSGALDLPGTTWRDRPAIDRGDGIFLCGDQVAATGACAKSRSRARSKPATVLSGTADHAPLPTPRDRDRLPGDERADA